MQGAMKFQEGSTQNKGTQRGFHSILEDRHERMGHVNIKF